MNNHFTTHSFRVASTDVDFQDKMFYHALLSIIQEAASSSAQSMGCGSDFMDANSACWLLLKMSVRMKSLPAWGEHLRVETWSRGKERLFFYRDFRIFNEQNSTIGVATSTWIVADKETHRPIKPDFLNDFIDKYSREEKAVTTKISPLPKPDTFDSDSPGNEITKHADYSELDRNLHVNNTRYIAWSFDALHYEFLTSYDILSMDVQFLSEIRFGEKVTIKAVNNSDGHLVFGIISDGRTAFVCKLFNGNLECSDDRSDETR